MSEPRIPQRSEKSFRAGDGFGACVLAGARAILPVLAGAVPFALISGAAPVQEGVSAAAAIGMSLIVFAGAAQIAAAQLIGSGTGPVLIVLTVAVINLRFVMYSASLAPHFGEPPARWKALLSYLLTDQAYAVAVTRFTAPDEAETQVSGETNSARGRIGYYLGAALTVWVVWQIGTVSGVILGPRVPEALALDFAVPLVFLALLFSAVTDRTSAAAALGAGAVALLGAGLPLNLGLVAAIAAGVLIGMSGPPLGGVIGKR